MIRIASRVRVLEVTLVGFCAKKRRGNGSPKRSRRYLSRVSLLVDRELTIICDTARGRLLEAHTTMGSGAWAIHGAWSAFLG